MARRLAEIVVAFAAVAAVTRRGCGPGTVGGVVAKGSVVDNDTLVSAIHLTVNPSSRGVVMQWTCADNESRLLLWSHGQNSSPRMLLATTVLVAKGGAKNEWGIDRKEGVLADLQLRRVVMKDLVEDTIYQYKIVTGSYGQTAYFRTWPEGSDWSAELLVLGKMYDTSSILWQSLVEDVQERGRYAGLINVGAYVTSGAATEQSYLASATEISGYLPVFSTLNSHATARDFASYDHLYAPPGDDGSRRRGLWWYSFDVSWAHVISFCSEVYFMTGVNSSSTTPADLAEQQLRWLEADLQLASSSESRRVRPWIVAFGSRPVYCGVADSSCVADAAKLDKLEDLFVRYRVNLVIQADDYVYQRTWPVARGQVAASDYDEYSGPVYVSTNVQSPLGDDAYPAQDCRESWCAQRYADPGSSYGRLRIRSPNLLRYEEIAIGSGFSEVVIDSFELRMTAPPTDGSGGGGVGNNAGGGAAVTLSILVPVAAVVIGAGTAFALCRRRPPYGRGGSENGSLLGATLKRARQCFRQGGRSGDCGDDDDGSGGCSGDGTTCSSLTGSGSSVAYSALSYGHELP